MLQINTTISQSQDPDLQYFWSEETIATNADDQHDTEFLHSYQSTSISRDSNGTYIPKFPWKENKLYLFSNFNIFKRRTLALVSKLKQSPELLQLYTNILKEQENCLMVGPPFLSDLCTILLSFRLHPFAFFTDVEKAFLHVKLH